MQQKCGCCLTNSDLIVIHEYFSISFNRVGFVLMDLKKKSVKLKVMIITGCSERSGSGWCSRYSDSPQVELSGDRIPVGARFPAPVHTGPGARLTSYLLGTGLFRGV